MPEETFEAKFEYFCPHCFHPLTINEDEQTESIPIICPNHPNGSVEYKYVTKTVEETD